MIHQTSRVAWSQLKNTTIKIDSNKDTFLILWLIWHDNKVNVESYYSSTEYILPYMQQLRLFIQWFWKYSTCLVLTLKVFQYSFSQTILMFFNRLKRDVILVRSPQNFHQWLTMNWSLSKCSFSKKTLLLWKQWTKTFKIDLIRISRDRELLLKNPTPGTYSLIFNK